jgi:hypothetical protein
MIIMCVIKLRINSRDKSRTKIFETSFFERERQEREMPYEVESVKSLKRGFKDHEKAQELLERIAKEVGFIKSSSLDLHTSTISRNAGKTVDVQTQMESKAFD